MTYVNMLEIVSPVNSKRVNTHSQLAFTCSKLVKETVEQGMASMTSFWYLYC